MDKVEKTEPSQQKAKEEEEEVAVVRQEGTKSQGKPRPGC